jgi:small subunit ribosomal protein S5
MLKSALEAKMTEVNPKNPQKVEEITLKEAPEKSLTSQQNETPSDKISKTIDAKEKRTKNLDDKSGEDQRISWIPKTSLGKKVKEGSIKHINEILDYGLPIFEAEIVEELLPEMDNDLLLIGQAKGKFGGGQRRIFRQTQKKTAEGNKPKFAVCAVIGNKNGYVGVGYGKSKETVPAREKAMRRAKLNIKRIRRGCGSWQCGCGSTHSIPYAVEGKCGSVRLRLIPAPKGKGLVAQEEIQKILRLAGLKDVWSKSFGITRTSMNLVYACVDALNKLVEMKVKEDDIKQLGLVEGEAVGRQNE